MKVLFFSHQADFIYGGEVVTLAFMRELQRQGVEVHFASPEGPYLERAREFARCYTVPSIQFSRRLIQLPRLLGVLRRVARDLRQVMLREEISILHATSLKAMVYAWPLGSSAQVIWHHHDILPPGLMNSLWVQALSARARLILTPSDATRLSLVQAGVLSQRVKVLRNGFPVQEWHTRPERKPGQLFRIGLVGEISPRKGTDRLETILKELGSLDGLQVLVIGEGLSDPEFARRLQERLASRTVRFLGRRSRMKELYAEMDVLLVPSRQDPLPTVIVEAGLSGVPVVGARVGGIPEMIAPGENGFLFDSEAEAAKAIRLCQENWLSLSRGARKIAESRYDIRRLTADLLGVYASLVERI